MSVSTIKTYFLIVGGGVAGVSAAEAIHKVDPTADITLISDEPSLPYFRMNLTRYLAGEIARDQLDLHKEGWYLENHINIVVAAHVIDIDSRSKLVTLNDGRIFQ